LIQPLNLNSQTQKELRTMSERENELVDEAIDPPDNQGGGEMTLEPAGADADAEAIDPPDNQGGGRAE
jgi:hypothetical protein